MQIKKKFVTVCWLILSSWLHWEAFRRVEKHTFLCVSVGVLLETIKSWGHWPKWWQHQLIIQILGGLLEMVAPWKGGPGPEGGMSLKGRLYPGPFQLFCSDSWTQEAKVASFYGILSYHMRRNKAASRECAETSKTLSLSQSFLSETVMGFTRWWPERQRWRWEQLVGWGSKVRGNCFLMFQKMLGPETVNPVWFFILFS